MTDKTAAKKLFIKTYGCQMNVYDSQRMAEAMGAEGYVLTEDQSEADMVLLNTCHIRDADFQIGPFRLQRLEAAEVGIKLLGGLFADMASVDQDKVGVLKNVRRLIAVNSERI